MLTAPVICLIVQILSIQPPGSEVVEVGNGTLPDLILKVENETLLTLYQNSNTPDEIYPDLKEAYKTINEYLIDNVKTNEPEENMSFVTKMFERNLTKSAAPDQQLVQAFGYLIELSRIANGSICNKANYKILEVNVNGTQGWTRMFSRNDRVIRRIDKLVRYFSIKYTNRCRWIHSADLKKKYTQLEKSTVGRVENLTGSFIEKTFKHDSGGAYIEPMHRYFINEPHLGIYDGPFLRQKIGLYAKDDPDRVYLNSTVDERLGVEVVNKTKLKELYNRYLGKPCEYYVAQLKEIFELADLENKVYHDVDPDDQDYYLTWARYEICAKVVNDSYSQTLLYMAVRDNS